MLGPAELVGSRLIDRHCHRSGRRIAAVGSAMQSEGLGIRGFDHLGGFLHGLGLNLGQAAAGCRRPGVWRSKCCTMAALTASAWVSGSMWPAPSIVCRRL